MPETCVPSNSSPHFSYFHKDRDAGGQGLAGATHRETLSLRLLLIVVSFPDYISTFDYLFKRFSVFFAPFSTLFPLCRLNSAVLPGRVCVSLVDLGAGSVMQTEGCALLCCEQ